MLSKVSHVTGFFCRTNSLNIRIHALEDFHKTKCIHLYKNKPLYLSRTPLRLQSNHDLQAISTVAEDKENDLKISTDAKDGHINFQMSTVAEEDNMYFQISTDA